MPRVYIQWLVAFGFGSIGAFPAVDFGYAEGSYPPPSGSEEFSSAVDRYETVPLLNGSGGMGEEKFLIVGIGGDADMFYGLVDEFSPERIAVLVPRAAVTHTSIPFLTSRLQKLRKCTDWATRKFAESGPSQSMHTSKPSRSTQ